MACRGLRCCGPGLDSLEIVQAIVGRSESRTAIRRHNPGRRRNWGRAAEELRYIEAVVRVPLWAPPVCNRPSVQNLVVIGFLAFFICTPWLGLDGCKPLTCAISIAFWTVGRFVSGGA
jgi:hypothetical protein